HPMVPFHGQGMNCALEDAASLAASLQQHSASFGAALRSYEAERQPNAYAIQAMALENYVEMRQRVSAADYLLERELAAWLTQRYPNRFVPRYSMVTFSCMPYALAYERGKIQAEILQQGVAGCNSFDQVNLAAVERNVLERLDALQV